MSGGSFDYNCFRISQFAADLAAMIEENDSEGGEEFSLETIGTLRKCQAIIALAGELAHHIEWLYSGDHGEETFMRLANKDLGSRLK
jgi:hypothetical protein